MKILKIVAKIFTFHWLKLEPREFKGVTTYTEFAYCPECMWSPERVVTIFC